jgi:hypothetical protein
MIIMIILLIFISDVATKPKGPDDLTFLPSTLDTCRLFSGGDVVLRSFF